MVCHTSSQNHLSSVATLTIEFHAASGSNISTRTVRWKLHEMGYHGRAAGHKPNITMCNAKHRLEWCKARRHWTLDQWKRVLWSDELRFTIWQSDGRICVCPIPGERYLPQCIVPIWWMRKNGLGLFFMVRARPLSSIEGTLQHTKKFYTILCFQLCGHILGKVLSCFSMTVRKTRSIQKWFAKIGMEELDWPPQRIGPPTASRT